MCTNQHTLTCLCTHTHMHSHGCAFTPTCSPMCAHTYMHSHLHAHPHVHLYIYALTLTCTHTCVHIHTCTHAHAHTYMFTHTRCPRTLHLQGTWAEPHPWPKPCPHGGPASLHVLDVNQVAMATVAILCQGCLQLLDLLGQVLVQVELGREGGNPVPGGGRRLQLSLGRTRAVGMQGCNAAASGVGCVSG